MADIEMTASLDNSDYLKRMNEIQASLTQVSQQVQQQNAAIGNAFDSVKSKGFEFLSMLGIATGLKSFASQVANVRGEFQQLESAFTTLLGNEDKAMSLMSQLTRTAAITPFGLQDVASSAKQLLAYGIAADEVNGKIMELGNVASGMGLSMSYMTMLYGTTASKDFMDTMDLKQHKGQGIPIEEAIANVMGIQKKDVASAVSNRQVTSEVYSKAVSQLTGEGGKFDGMMEAQSKTITGQISNIEDAVSVMFNDIGKNTEGIISDVLSGATWVVENYKQVAEAIGAVAASYGMYKAALVATTAVQTASAKSEIEALSEILEKENEVHGDAQLEAMVKKGQLTEDEANALLTLRQEVAERQKQYDEDVKYYADIEKSIQDELQAKQEEFDIASEELQQALQRQSAAEAIGDAEEAQAAAQDVAAAATLRDNAARESQVLITRQATASEALSTAETKAKTFATQTNTIATSANSKAQQFCGLVGKQLTGVFNGLKAAMISNPIGAVCAAMTALAYGIYKIVSYKSEWEQAQDAINESMSKGAASASSEIVKLQSLTNRLAEAKEAMEAAQDAQSKNVQGINDTTEALGNEDEAAVGVNDAQLEYNRIKNDIINQFGDYHKGLDNEIDKLIEENSLYTTLSSNIMTYHMQKAKSEATSSAMDAYTESVSEVYDKIDAKIKGERANSLKASQYALSEGRINDVQYQERVAVWDKAEKEIKSAVMNGTLSYDASNMRIQAFVDGINKISKETSDLFLVTSQDGDHNSLGALATTVAERAKILQDSLKEIDRKYDEAFLTNGVSDEDKQGDGDLKVTNSHYLENLKKQIEDARKEVEQARKDVAAGKMYTPAGSSKEVAMDAEYVSVKAKREQELLSQWKTATGKDFDEKKSNNSEKRSIDMDAAQKDLDRLRKDLSELQRQNEESAIKQTREMMLAEEQNVINLMSDGVQKRIAQRKLDNKKEILAIYEQAEERKEAVIAKAKQEFEAQEAIKEKEANSKGKTYTRRDFDRDAFVQSQVDEGGGGTNLQFAEIDEWAEKQYATIRVLQEKEQKAVYQQDLKDYKDYWQNLYSIYTSYAETMKSIEDDTTLVDAEQIMQQQRIAKMNLNDQLAAAGIDINSVDAEQGSMIADLSSFVEQILGDSISTIESTLEEALSALDAMSESEQSDRPDTTALLKAKINAANARIKELKAKEKNKGVEKSVITSWKNWSGVIEDATDSLAEVGETIGGAVGEAFSAVSEIGGSVINIINNITNLASVSLQTTEVAAESTSEAIQKAERASVILAIIQAAMRLFQLLDGFLNGDESREAWEKAVAKQQEINKMTDAVNSYRSAVLAAQQEEKRWFSSTGFETITDAADSAQSAITSYNSKLSETQVTYQNEKGGKSFLARVGNVIKATGGAGVSGAIDYWKGKNKTGDITYSSAIDNLRFETQSAKKGGFFKKGRDQKTTDLRSWAKETYGSDLFDENNMIDVEMAQNIIENYGDKLVGETKATLQSLIEEAQAYQEAMDSLKETVSDWYSPLVDDMTDALMNWLDTGDDVLSTFEDNAGETFRNIAQEMMKTMIQSTIFDGFQDDIKKLAEQYGKGEITMDEMIKQSAARTKEAINTAEEAMPALQSALTEVNDYLAENGIDISNSASDQEATYGGYETMSEETGTELSGRFSAMYIVQSQHLALAQGMSDKLAGALSLLGYSNNNIGSLVNLSQQANTLLTSLVRTTNMIYNSWNERIEHIEKYTKNLD